MKEKLILIFLLAFAANAYCQDYQTPYFMAELNSGYALGFDFPNAIPVEIKFTTYTYKNFGFTAQAGVLTGDNISFHTFFGPAFFIINNSKMRLPVSIGIDLFLKDGNESYLGFGGIISYQYVITKNIYIGINVSASCNFIGTENKITGVNSNGSPVIESNIIFKNNFYIKPSIGIGFQI